MKKILSIVIPVYNVEKYLEKCIDSIISQDLTECEVILVDDGSPDKSGEICDKYKKANFNIQVYHKENGGLSDARNYGIGKATGEYIWFIDSDDFIEDNSIKNIIEKLKENELDVLVCTSKVIDENSNTNDECKYTIKTGLYSREEYLQIMKKNPKALLFCAQYHICKRELIVKNSLYFQKGIIHEDELWTPQILLHAQTIYYSNFKIYYHYMRSDSIMHASKFEKSGECNLFVAEKLIGIFNKCNIPNIEYLRDRNINLFFQAVWKIPNFIQRKSTISRLAALENSYYLKTKLKALLYFLSPKIYIKVHNALMKMVK